MAKVTAEGIHRFIGNVDDTVDNLKEQLKHTEALLDDIIPRWQDNQAVKFKNGFDEDKDVILPLCDKLEQWIDDVLYPLEKIIIRYNDL